MTKRTAALAEAIEERIGRKVDTVDDHDDEVYVDVESYATDAHAAMDDVCAIAYDHGFVPVGIIDSGAARLVLRDDEVSV